jgi:hypothetical protein
MAKQVKQTAQQKAVSEANAKAKVKSANELAVINVNPKAMQVSIGPTVVANLAQSLADIDKANELFDRGEKKRWDSLAALTLGIYNAVIADKGIDLASVTTDDKRRKNILFDQLGIALGTREAFLDDKGKQIITTAKAVQQYFPGPKEDRNSPEYKRKDQLRANFTTNLKKCAIAALGLVERNIKPEIDKESGTLLITGPAVKEHFGQSEVLLNEKQTVETTVKKRGKEETVKTELKAKPSFTELGRIGAAATGTVLATRKDSRATVVPKVDTETAIVGQADTFVRTLAKLDTASSKVRAALEKVRSAIDVVLNKGKPEEKAA